MPNIWSISDIHLAHAVPHKNMELLFPDWKNYTNKIRDNWQHHVQLDDTVLIPGDISWGNTLQEALTDLEWLHSLNGTKVLIKGNHDKWWKSKTQIQNNLPPSVHIVQNDSFYITTHSVDIGVFGTKLHDVPDSRNWFINEPEYKFDANQIPPFTPHDTKLINREILRLQHSYNHLLNYINRKEKQTILISMLHYPPCAPSMNNTIITQILSSMGVDICVFGHLHNFRSLHYTHIGRTLYMLVSADIINFTPKKILEY